MQGISHGRGIILQSKSEWNFVLAKKIMVPAKIFGGAKKNTGVSCKNEGSVSKRIEKQVFGKTKKPVIDNRKRNFLS